MTRLFEVQLKDIQDGVFAISLVDEPAVEEDFIMLNKEADKIDVYLTKVNDKLRHVLTGVALIPNKVIPRQNHDVIFPAEVIRSISEKFLLENNNNNVTIQHQTKVNKVGLVESWIVDNPNLDKAKALGFDVPKGTWMVSYKILDDDLWNEYIVNKTLRGFSIEGIFTKKEIKPITYSLDEEIENIALSIYYSEADLDQKFVWKMKKGEKENCPICLGNNNKVHTLREWLSIGIPAVANNKEIAGLRTSYATNPYATYCQDSCQCSLVKVGTEDRRKLVRILKPF